MLRGRLAAACDRQFGAPASSLPPSTDELLVLSTCHRVELYAVASNREVARTDLISGLFTGLEAALSEDGGPIYVRSGIAAVEHLCRVACGLDSMIVGEAEIVGQIRRAAMAARLAGTLGPFLERVVAGATSAGGRARSETRIGKGAMSAAGAGVALVERALGSLADRAVLVVGAGEAGRQALTRLARRRAGRLIIASRSAHHARQASEKSGAEVIGLDHIGRALADVDAAIVATRASGYLIDAAGCQAAVAERPGRPLVVVDLSVPRVVDPAVAGVEGVIAAGVDDLGDIVRESVAQRQAEIPRVELIVREEAARAYRRFARRRERRSAAAVA